jgi:hypothetical protein
VIHPGLLVFDLNPEGPAVASDKVIKGILNKAYERIPVFFQHGTVSDS